MSTQIAVRIPAELMSFVDEQVANGAASRADVVRRALERERRRAVAERDAMIYAQTEPNEEMNAIVAAQRQRGYPSID